MPFLTLLPVTMGCIFGPTAAAAHPEAFASSLSAGLSLMPTGGASRLLGWGGSSVADEAARRCGGYDRFSQECAVIFRNLNGSISWQGMISILMVIHYPGCRDTHAAFRKNGVYAEFVEGYWDWDRSQRDDKSPYSRGMNPHSGRMTALFQ